jgi:hypothetical protein
MAKPKHDLRAMRQAARAGDHSAARALLKLYGFDEIAAEIKRGLPFSPRVHRQIRALTAENASAQTRSKAGSIGSKLRWRARTSVLTSDELPKFSWKPSSCTQPLISSR